MAVRCSRTQDLKRTASLPSSTAFTICGWGRLQSDDNDFGGIAFLDNGSNPTQYVGLEVQSDGVELRVIGSGGTGVTVATLVVGTDFFWAVRSSGAGANQTNAAYRTAATPAIAITNMGARGAVTPTQLTLGGSGFGDAFGERWNGRLWNVKCWDRAVSDAELQAESFSRRVIFPASLNFHLPLDRHTDTNDYSGNGRNPTVTGTLTTEDSTHGLARPRRRIFLPTSSLQSFSYTAVGGLTLGGAAGVLRARVSAVAGGLTLGGAAAFAKGKVIAAAGGLQLGGTAAQIRVRVPSPAGGIQLGGAADVQTSGTQQFSYTAQGGISLGGAAAQLRVAVPTALGGLQLGGAATVASHEQQRVVTPSGGITLGGAASVSTFDSGAKFGDSPLLRRRRR